MLTAGTIRVAPALALIKVVADLGLDPAPILAEAGWSPALLDDPDSPVPFAALGRLVTVAASRTGCDHFGLLVGQKAGPAAIGAVGFAARNAPDVRSALRLLIAHVGHHDRGAVATFAEHGAVATLGYRICHPALPGGDHITDGSLAICVQLMRVLCGPHWRPLETCFTHCRPADPRPYHAQFGKRVRFDAEQSALSFATHWLDGKIAGADPELQRLLLRMVGDKEATREGDLRDEVRHAGMIGSGDTNQAAVARTFGWSSSTLHRRLAALDTSFQDLLDEVRCEIACRLLADSALAVSQVAAMLHYSEPSAFTRSFKRRLGCGPAAWRASKGTATPGEG